MSELANIPSTYNPQETEQKWYEYWEKNGFFHAEVEKDKKPYTIVMPPPNVTGSLHLGHAMDNTLQDILIRYHRMQGYNTLWVPGTDHAGIATQAKVEEHLAKDGLSKYDLGREKFLEKVWEWKDKYHNRISKQLRMLGSSCDWDRERFTMDEGCSKAVREVFVRLYEKGLIYRGNYIINWCPKCQTTISDIEVEHQDTPGQLWHVKYPIKGEEGSYITIATTRPETILGDTAVAVHPDDERYTDLVGKKVILPIVGREIPIIADSYVDPAFGTGAVKITPSHDPNDFEIGLRHSLPDLVVIDKAGKMTEEAGKYQGLDRYECREQIVADLKEQGYLLKIEEHNHAVGHCYRCDTIIEPLVSSQWFVKMKPLAKPAIQAVLDGNIRFVPERFTKIYLGWLENIRDWCISRQLWWGHRIPVWYCQDCGEMICASVDPTSCPSCASTNLEQDPDVLDTWFSSGLWPFSTLGWPEKTPELEHFYPTSVLVTGRDIIFFWVARMIFTSLEFMHEEPFKDVFIHGLILDAQGRKMSKSLGNGVDPIEVIEKYGADTLRFMLVTGNTPGNDLRFQFERLEGTRNFANKIWNASRFVLMNLSDFEPESQKPEYTLADRWILTKYNQVVEQVTNNLDKYEMGEAAKAIYEFIWSQFCDWYIELVKPRLYGKETPKSKYTAQYVLNYVLTNTLKLLHPFMPFITEEIWQHLPEKGKSIMVSKWPQTDSNLVDKDAEESMDLLMEVIRSIRNIRAEMNVPPGKKAEVIIMAKSKEAYAIVNTGQEYVARLANGEPINIYEGIGTKPSNVATAIVGDLEIYLPLEGLIDLEVEIKRLEKELSQTKKELERVTGKLSNEGFLTKAPQEVIAKEQAKQRELLVKEKALLERLKMFRG
ncbi:MAG: valine--tRNA ligase [Zhaonellaceae bacterium]|jgi:valyl-tRNA synthetase|nr:valine--tRNA ligase [Clostridia bacterium]